MALQEDLKSKIINFDTNESKGIETPTSTNDFFTPDLTRTNLLQSEIKNTLQIFNNLKGTFNQKNIWAQHFKVNLAKNFPNLTFTSYTHLLFNLDLKTPTNYQLNQSKLEDGGCKYDLSLFNYLYKALTFKEVNAFYYYSNNSFVLIVQTNYQVMPYLYLVVMNAKITYINNLDYSFQFKTLYNISKQVDEYLKVNHQTLDTLLASFELFELLKKWNYNKEQKQEEKEQNWTSLLKALNTDFQFIKNSDTLTLNQLAYWDKIIDFKQFKSFFTLEQNTNFSLTYDEFITNYKTLSLNEQLKTDYVYLNYEHDTSWNYLFPKKLIISKLAQLEYYTHFLKYQELYVNNSAHGKLLNQLYKQKQAEIKQLRQEKLKELSISEFEQFNILIAQQCDNLLNDTTNEDPQYNVASKQLDVIYTITPNELTLVNDLRQISHQFTLKILLFVKNLLLKDLKFLNEYDYFTLNKGSKYKTSYNETLTLPSYYTIDTTINDVDNPPQCLHVKKQDMTNLYAFFQTNQKKLVDQLKNEIMPILTNIYHISKDQQVTNDDLHLISELEEKH